MRGERADYYARRKSMGCANCSSFNSVDAVSQLCPPCKKHLIVHGSARIPKPLLKREINLAYHRINHHCDITQTTEVFNSWMISYASPSRNDLLRRLCYLHFIKLEASDGFPVMRFVDALVQALAVTIYEQDGGVLDNQKKQYQYLLGRASVCPWHRRRQSKQGTIYNKEERRDIQRKPTIFHRAFKEVFLEAGLAGFISQLNHTIKNIRQ